MLDSFTDLKVAGVLGTFFATQNFDVAWKHYLDWTNFQAEVGRVGQVWLAGCFVNNKPCWEVLLTQAIHDARVETLPKDIASIL